MISELQGLSSSEVDVKKRQFGENILPEKAKQSNFSLFIAQLKSPLIYILLIAGMVTLAIGHFSDAIIILLAVGVNSLLGFIQERKASDALYALRHYVANTTTVVRDGKRQTVNTTELVPGDLVILNEGVKIPADGVAVEVNRFFVDESILTGESVSVRKEVTSEVYMGTTVAVGQAVFKVETIGAQTKMGAIAAQIQETEEDTPLQRQLQKFSKQLLIVVAILISCVFSIGVFRQFSFTEVFVTSVALAVSSIPEGLIISLTVVLAIGMQKILRRKGLVRKLSAAETLGGVTVICVDKTGTLTEGKMEVVKAVGEEKLLAEQVLVANDLDDPIVIAAYAWGKKVLPDFVSQNKRLDSIPFSSESRCFMSLNELSNQKNRLFVNGAPEVVLSWAKLTRQEKLAVENSIEELTKQGKRLIGLAYQDVSKEKNELKNSDGKKDLTWVGLLAFSDPIRSGVKEALFAAQGAGIRTIVITGDYAKTSQFILEQLDISLTKEQVITGEEVKDLSVEELAKKVRSVRLFARTTPSQKLMIVEALKHNGEVVAMMGDGVNDAPALHSADIGIAVGGATDVAKESADLVILDSNFSTIVAAIEEGRGIFENIRKIILYLMSDAFAEIIVILGSMLLGFPLALTAVQILWINLVSDGFPNLTLTIDPLRKGMMQEAPRSPQEKLVNKWMVILIGVVSTLAGLLALASFAFVYEMTGDIILARSMAFITLGLNSLAYVFSVRALTVPFWKNHLFENKWLVIAVVAGFGLQVLPFVTAQSRQFFGLSQLGFTYWLVAIGLSIIMFFVVEVFKFVYHFRGNQKEESRI